MIRLTDSLKEVLLVEGSNAGKVIFDGNKAFVGMAHSIPPKISPETLKKVKDIGDEHGYWYEGNAADNDIIKQVFGDIKFIGSWDEKVVSTVEPYFYVYTLFSNPSQNNRVDQVFNGKGETVYDKILSTYKDWSHELIKNKNGKELVDKFLERLGSDALEKVQQKGTRENIKNFIMPIGHDDKGSMWIGWPKGSGPAFEMAKEAVYDRDKWLKDKAPDGVYFTGEGHLDSLKDINDGYEIV